MCYLDMVPNGAAGPWCLAFEGRLSILSASMHRCLGMVWKLAALLQRPFPPYCSCFGTTWSGTEGSEIISPRNHFLHLIGGHHTFCPPTRIDDYYKVYTPRFELITLRKLGCIWYFLKLQIFQALILYSVISPRSCTISIKHHSK